VVISLFYSSVTIDKITPFIMNSHIVLTSLLEMNLLRTINAALILNIDRTISFKMC